MSPATKTGVSLLGSALKRVPCYIGDSLFWGLMNSETK